MLRDMDRQCIPMFRPVCITIEKWKCSLILAYPFLHCSFNDDRFLSRHTDVKGRGTAAPPYANLTISSVDSSANTIARSVHQGGQVAGTRGSGSSGSIRKDGSHDQEPNRRGKPLITHQWQSKVDEAERAHRLLITLFSSMAPFTIESRSCPLRRGHLACSTLCAYCITAEVGTD